MVLELISHCQTFKHGFILVGYLRIKLKIQPLFHWPDHEESGAAIKYNAVGCCADEYLGPVGHFCQDLIKNQHELFGAAFEKTVQAYPLTIMPEFGPG